MEAIKRPGCTAPRLVSRHRRSHLQEARRLGISNAWAQSGLLCKSWHTSYKQNAVWLPCCLSLHTNTSYTPRWISRAGVLPKGRALVPGCGRGYDSIAFGKSGYDSIGLDLSPTGVEQAKALLAEEKEENISGKARQELSKHLSVVSRDGISLSCVRLKQSRDTGTRFRRKDVCQVTQDTPG